MSNEARNKASQVEKQYAAAERVVKAAARLNVAIDKLIATGGYVEVVRYRDGAEEEALDFSVTQEAFGVRTFGNIPGEFPKLGEAELFEA